VFRYDTGNLAFVEDAGMSKDLERLERRRMRAAELFAQGLSQAQVARKLRVSPQSAHRWHEAWKEKGKEGLKAAPRKGPEPRLGEADLRRLDEALLAGPGQFGYRTELWTLSRIAEVIGKLFGVRHHPSQVWRILKGLGWSCQKPATRAKERDEKAIQKWLRERWPEIKKRPSEPERG